MYTESSALTVDGGVEEMCAFAESQELAITLVTHTHRHPAHTCGNRDLIDRTVATEFERRNFLMRIG